MAEGEAMTDWERLGQEAEQGKRKWSSHAERRLYEKGRQAVGGEMKGTFVCKKHGRATVDGYLDCDICGGVVPAILEARKERDSARSLAEEWKWHSENGWYGDCREDVEWPPELPWREVAK